MSTTVPMYYRCIPELVTLDPELHPYSSHLFTCIAHKAYLNSGKVQMTTEYLAQISRLSEKTVQRYLPQLEEKGYLKIHRAPKGSKIPNIYEIVGEVAEVVIRKSKTETEHATQAPSSTVVSAPQGAGRPSTPKPDSKSTLNAQASERPSTTINPLLGRHEDPSDARSTAAETFDHATDRPTTKEQEKQSSTYEESNVVEEPFNEKPIFSVEGVKPSVMQDWTDTYGVNRLRNAINMMQKQKNIGNKGGWLRCALEQGWDLNTTKKRKGDRTTTQDLLNSPYAQYYANARLGSEIPR